MEKPENYELHLYKSNSLLAFLPKAIEIINKISHKNPFEKKFVVVQNGILGRWLALRTAEETGISANIGVVSPDEFLRTFAEKHFKIDTRNSVFTRKNLEWAVFALFKSDFLEKSELEPVRNYIKNNENLCFPLCRRIAALFEKYAVYRPQVFENWLRNSLCTGNPDEIWQKEIFTALRAKYRFEHDFAKLFIEKCEKACLSDDFPTSLILFGISRMNKYHLNMVRHLSRLFPVHIFALQQSKEYVDKPGKETFFRRFCAAGIEINDFFADYPPFEESEIFIEPKNKTLLASIQRDILNDEENPENTESDDSLEISACCGKMREIEVLKDSLLQLFNDDETLTPGDIAVFCPDIKSYAPYINAVFGSTPQNDKTFIPFTVSDGKQASENGISAAFLKIIGLNSGNFTKSDVLSIFKEPFICEKFGIRRENFDEIEKIIDESGIKRGISGQNSWDFGLKRILMSSFLPFSEDGKSFEDILPLENFSGDKINEIEGFLTFIKGLFRFSEEIKTEKTAEEFKYSIENMIDFFFVREQGNEEIRQIRNIVANFAENAGKYSEKISFDAVRSYLEDEIGNTASGRVLFGAKVNFSPIKRMCGIPFKVVCLIGMDTESFPGKDSEYAFDLTHALPAIGDEPGTVSRRENDFHLFLESIAAAGRKLILSYDAGDLREDSKKHRKTAIPVQILEKYILLKTAAGTEEGNEVSSERIETKQPVFSFSPEYFFNEKSSFRTFSKRDFAAAKNFVSRETSVRKPYSAEVSEQKNDSGKHIEISLEELIKFFKDPQEHYFKKNLGLILPKTEKDKKDEEIFDYDDNLMNYSLRKVYFEMSHGMPDKAAADENFIRRTGGEGKIPPGIIGEEKLKSVVDDAGIWKIAGNFYAEETEYIDFTIDFEELNVSLSGRINGLRKNKTKMVLAFVSSWKTKYKIETLIRHYAANAKIGRVETEVFAVKIDKKNILRPLERESAKEKLSAFIRLYLSAQTEMPLYTPDIIEDFRIAVSKDKIIDGDFITSEIEKTENGQFTSDYFLLAAEQFKKERERFLERFPETEICEISEFLKEFTKN